MILFPPFTVVAGAAEEAEIFLSPVLRVAIDVVDYELLFQFGDPADPAFSAVPESEELVDPIPFLRVPESRLISRSLSQVTSFRLVSQMENECLGFVLIICHLED